MMRRYRLLLLIPVFAFPTVYHSFGQKLEELEIFREEYPRAGYFRVSEFVIRQSYNGKPEAYEAWRDRFADLSGIMGKTEYEELLDNNPHDQIRDWFTRYKRDFPEKFVMVHMNGRGRIPNYRLEKFSPGHWLYFEGTDVKSDLPGEESGAYEQEAWIQVADPDRFREDNGPKQNFKDDITLVRKNKDGSFDWEHAEYVRLLEKRGDSIRVSRAMFGSTALRFSKNETYAAPHIMEGPWGETTNMVWYYNLSTSCPKDKDGKTCADILLEEFADNFKAGGNWAYFDGVQFDVMMSRPIMGAHRQRWALGEQADVDMDGKQDRGMINGVQAYGIGVFDFVKRLRQVVGPEKIIAADGRNVASQQVGNGDLNGVEMEGFPAQMPHGFTHWSTPINLLDFWQGVTRTPYFNYVAMRYDGPDRLAKEDLLAHYRLAFAGSVFTNSFVLANSWTTLRDIPDLREVFDLPESSSLVGWLGKPVGNTVHWAGTQQHDYADVLQGKGTPIKPSLLVQQAHTPYLHATAEETNGTATVTAVGTLIVAPQSNADEFGFVIKQVPFQGEQVYLEFTLRSGDMDGRYPDGYLRSASIVVNGMKLPNQLTNIIKMNGEWFTYRVYFANSYDTMLKQPIVYNKNGETAVDIEVVFHDVLGPVEVSKLMINNAPEVVYRQFEHGMVFANLSNSAVELAEYQVVVPAKDACFIRKQN